MKKPTPSDNRRLTPQADAVLATVKKFHIKFVSDNAEDRRFTLVDAETGQVIRGFASFGEAANWAEIDHKPITDQVYQPNDEPTIEPATAEEIAEALNKVQIRSELNQVLGRLKVGEGIKVRGDLKKLPLRVYAFAHASSKSFTVRKDGDKLLIIRQK